MSIDHASAERHQIRLRGGRLVLDSDEPKTKPAQA